MSKEFFKGKNILVTGATSGIGRATSLRFAEAGAHVLATGRRMDKLNSLVDETKDYEGSVTPHQADLIEKKEIEELIPATIAALGTIDILVNNAAFGRNANLKDTDPDDIEKIIQTNLIAPILLTRATIPHMEKQNSGNLVYVTSLAGKLGFPGLATYSASKFGVEGLADSVRREVSNSNIWVTVLRPGVTDTEFFEHAGMQDFHASSKEAGTLHSPFKVADTLIDNLPQNPDTIVVGSDKWFLMIMPFLPNNLRFRALDLVNKVLGD